MAKKIYFLIDIVITLFLIIATISYFVGCISASPAGATVSNILLAVFACAVCCCLYVGMAFLFYETTKETKY